MAHSSSIPLVLTHLAAAQDALAAAATELAEDARQRNRIGSKCADLAALTTDCHELVSAIHAIAEVLATTATGSEARP